MTLTVGSPDHKLLFCRFFIDTHTAFEPAALPWPELDDACRGRLATLPIWNEAVTTEAETAMKVRARAEVERDPLLREAIGLQAYEEARHAEMLRMLVDRYGIEARSTPDLTPPPDPDWAFMRVGYGECFDSFFAFGLFGLARDSGFFTPDLVRLFEPVMQEEARHILFHVNWVAHSQAQLPFAGRSGYMFRRGLALWLQVASRIRTAMRVGAEARTQDNFTLNAHESFGTPSLPEFLRLCLRENYRRLAPYDTRLLRPDFVPKLARTLLRGLGRGRRAAGPESGTDPRPHGR